MSATMSILGLYEFNKHLFSGFVMPNGVNREIVINNLLMECAEFEVLYPDPVFMQSAISYWSRSMLSVWKELYDTTKYEYNPIHNYDRHEEYSDESESVSSRNSYENAGFVDAAKATGELSHEAHLYGNIGVMSTQDMIKQQRDVVEFNINQRIIDDFKKRFCLMIY